MIGSIIGAGMSVASGIIGGISARNAARKQARMLANEKKKNQAWYDRRYNEDSTQRADAQSALNQMRSAMQERSQRTAGTAAVMGTGEEAAAAEKEIQNNALAKTVSNINAQGEARKDDIEERYQARDAELTDQQRQAQADKAQSVTGAITSAFGAAGGIASGLDSIKSEPTKKMITSVPDQTVVSPSSFVPESNYGLVDGKIVR